MSEISPLSIARKLIDAGAPVFVAKADPSAPGGYRLPKQWQYTPVDSSTLLAYSEGDALAMVCGHAIDVVDVDPRNGGTLGTLPMPRVYAEAATPSGGKHYLIKSLGVRKGELARGVDLQAGNGAAEGRGFVFIAPTKRASKDPVDAGRVRPYVWTKAFDLDEFQEWADVDDSGASLRDLRDAQESARVKEPKAAENDPFDSNPERVESRAFTVDEAKKFVVPALHALSKAQGGQVEERANTAAAVLSHFVPEFWSADAAFRVLERNAKLSLNGTWQDGLTGWKLEKFRPVLDGRRPPIDAWKAVRREVTALEEEVSGELETPEKRQSAVEVLLGKMLDRDALDELPDPEYLIEGILEKNSESWMIGASGSFKSFIALDIAGHVSSGTKWQGLHTAQGRVVYVVAEGSKNIKKRVKAWESVYGQRMADVLILPEPVQVKAGGPHDMRVSEEWRTLAEACRILEPALIVLDTQARMTVGLEENSNSQMGLYVEGVRMLKEATGACVLTVHHTGRNGGDARGASAIDGAQDHEIRIDRMSSKKGDLRVVVSTDKNKDDAEDNEFRLQMKIVETGQNSQTGNPITSLAVDLVPFESVKSEEVPEWRMNLTENQAAVMYVMDEHSDEAGLTLSAIIGLLKEHGRMQGDVKRIKSCAYTAVKSLKAKDALVHVGQRYYLSEFAPE